MNRVMLVAVAAMLLCASKGPCPMKGGVIRVEKPRPHSFIGHPDVGIVIYGTDSLVRAAWDGEVQAVMNVGDVKALMIRTHDSIFMSIRSLIRCL